MNLCYNNIDNRDRDKTRLKLNNDNGGIENENNGNNEKGQICGGGLLPH